MTTFDLAPLWRSTVGFDRLFNLLEDSVEWTEDRYRISLALAGFSPDEVTITAEQNVLTVEGRKASKGTHQYLYQGISWRPFRCQFNLAEYVQVKGASFEDGMLKIDLLREVPEALKPRQIPINAVNDNEKLEHQQTG
jgi:molecular chaperone IbpA